MSRNHANWPSSKLTSPEKIRPLVCRMRRVAVCFVAEQERAVGYSGEETNSNRDIVVSRADGWVFKGNDEVTMTPK